MKYLDHYEFGTVANFIQMKIENDEMSIFQVVLTLITKAHFQRGFHSNF